METLLDEIGRQAADHAREAYFVGGCVRDLLRGEAIKDVDLALASSPHALGRALANRYDGHVFWLRQEDEVVRVILPGHDALQVDLCPLRGSLDEDLRGRDLTINAMAVPAGEGLHAGAPVIDPTGGRSDLDARVVRFVSPVAPEADPLRTLRALRFRWKLGFEIEPETAARLRECVPMLRRVSVERIRDELFQLLAIPAAGDALQECIQFGMLPWLTGKELPLPGSDGSLPAERLRAFDAVLEHAGPDAAWLLGEEVTPPRRRREVVRWAAALQPLVPALDPGAASRHLALSNDEKTLIVRGLAAAETACTIVKRWPARGRYRYRMFRDAGPAGVEAVLLAGAAEGWSEAFAELLEEALTRHYWPEAPLLTGVEVMQALDLPPGPRVGQVLQEVEELRADGLLRSPADAVRWLRERADH